MGIQNRSLFGPPADVPGHSPDPYATPAADLDSTSALAGLSATRDSAGDFRRAQAAASGEMSGGSAGFELESGDLETVGSVPDPEEFGTTAGGDDPLVTLGTLPEDSNLQWGQEV